jgi:hypothetical protein
MNPMIIFVVLAVAWFSWSLIRCIRTGVFSFGDGSYGRTVGRVRREDSPVAYWLVIAFHVGLILYVGSLVFEME